MVEVNRVKEKDKFVPISIVLETKEEADAMRNYLCCSDNETFSDACHRDETSGDMKIMQKVFDAFRAVHDY